VHTPQLVVCFKCQHAYIFRQQKGKKAPQKNRGWSTEEGTTHPERRPVYWDPMQCHRQDRLTVVIRVDSYEHILSQDARRVRRVQQAAALRMVVADDASMPNVQSLRKDPQNCAKRMAVAVVASSLGVRKVPAARPTAALLMVGVKDAATQAAPRAPRVRPRCAR
jgi:hypothetical protein